MEKYKMFVRLTFAICTLLASSSSKQVFAGESQYRLPTAIVPTKYTIELEFLGIVFIPGESNFSGKVKIDFKIVEETSDLKFHASKEYISITNLTLNGVELNDDQYNVNSTTDIVTIPNLIKEHELVKDGSYSMEIEYTGKISTTDNYGIYKSSYTKTDGDISYLLATQFEATYARRAFPCFDEPYFKAQFDMSIIYYSDLFGLSVLFNTKKNSEIESEGLTKVIFKTTPVMSTYLVAFTISDFSSTTGEIVDDTEYTVWSRDNLKSSREYATEIGPKILKALNGYTGRKYSEDIEKADQVALPDFAAGAMENWGLITYRERYLLWEKDNTVDTVKQSIATIIAHEFAHQWFGNLITCAWWSETFLNEGFATYFQYFITHEVEPTWELDKQFVVSVLQPVLDSDGLEHSQPLKSDVNTPQEISNKFGQISYNKGGSIVRMLSHIISEDTFKEAIQDYIQTEKLQFSTVTTSDLLEIYQNHIIPQFSAFPANVTLADVMQNWIEKPGYPLLTVSLNGTDLSISQERFLVSGVDEESKWFVPITYLESENDVSPFTAPFAWLTPSTPQINLTMETENSWVLLNTFQTGYYRVNYDTNLWKNIATALQKDNFDGLNDLNRAQIVDDLFNIAKAKKLSYSEVFDVIDFLENELSYFPWVPAFTGFEYILLRSPSNSQLKTKLQEHLMNLMDALYKTVPISKIEDDQIYTLTQSLASSWACQLGETTCVTEAKKIFAESIESNTKPNKNIRSVVYCNVLRYSSNVSDYDYLWSLYGKTEESNEQLIILRALGCSTNSDKLTELLMETLKDNSQIRSQDAASVFQYVYSGSEVGVDIALQFIIENFKAISTKYSSMSAQGSLIKGIAARLTTTEQVNKLKKLIADNLEFENDLKEVSQEALELTQSNLEWINAHQADLEKYYGISEQSMEDKEDSANIATINLIVLVLVNFILLFGF